MDFNIELSSENNPHFVWSVSVFFFRLSFSYVPRPVLSICFFVGGVLLFTKVWTLLNDSFSLALPQSVADKGKLDRKEYYVLFYV